MVNPLKKSIEVTLPGTGELNDCVLEFMCFRFILNESLELLLILLFDTSNL